MDSLSSRTLAAAIEARQPNYPQGLHLQKSKSVTSASACPSGLFKHKS